MPNVFQNNTERAAVRNDLRREGKPSNMAKLSRALVSKQIGIERSAGKGPKQAIAIALSMARKAGFPLRKSKKLQKQARQKSA